MREIENFILGYLRELFGETFHNSRHYKTFEFPALTRRAPPAGGPGQPGRAGDGGRRARADGRAQALFPGVEGAAHPVGVRRPPAQGLQGGRLASQEGE